MILLIVIGVVVYGLLALRAGIEWERRDLSSYPARAWWIVRNGLPKG